MVECHLAKVDVAGSNPVSRSDIVREAQLLGDVFGDLGPWDSNVERKRASMLPGLCSGLARCYGPTTSELGSALPRPQLPGQPTLAPSG